MASDYILDLGGQITVNGVDAPPGLRSSEKAVPAPQPMGGNMTIKHF